VAEREYRPLESKLVYEWVGKEYPKALQWRRVRLGPRLKGKEGAMYGVIRRWADLVFKDDNTIYIVEAKIRPDVGALAQLELYCQLFPKTPEFSEFALLPIKLIFLTSIDDKEARRLAKDKGIDFVVYSPQWVKDYWAELISKG